MIRVLAATALLGSTLLVSSGCGEPNEYEVSMEVTGTSGTAAEITVKTVDGGSPNTDEALPWTRTIVVPASKVSVEVKPSKGAVTCRLVIKGAEVDKVTGKDGETITCEKTIDRK